MGEPLKRNVVLLMIMEGSAALISKLREAAGKSREEISTIMGIGLPAYWDLESRDSEIRNCISLSQLIIMAGAFNVSPRDVLPQTLAS